MAAAVFSRPRVNVDGKFFRLGDKKFYVKGVAYGPFPPNATGQPFASPDQTAADFAQIRELGANLIRVYQVPGKWFLDLAEHHELKVLVDIPWNKHLCFLDSAEHREGVCDTVRRNGKRSIVNRAGSLTSITRGEHVPLPPTDENGRASNCNRNRVTDFLPARVALRVTICTAEVFAAP